ncbi:MAG: hypothetical protein P9L94_00440 [Candidatus Hinthialibacter antarcticus]|nr:hypothetical protein [Candidatus Hinthialibacter antarcticus]
MMTSPLRICAALVCAALMACVAGLPTAVAKAAVSRDKTNAFLLSNQGKLFFPQGANVGYLLQETVSARTLDSTLNMLADAGVNTVRVNLEDALGDGAALDALLDRTGMFRDEVMQRFEALLSAAETYQLQVVPILFDLQSMQEDWGASPYSEANGGPCESIHDFLMNAKVRQQSLTRAAQLIERFQGRNILAWELARGANVWDASVPRDVELRGEVLLWLNLVLDRVHQVNTERHLIAASFWPNTLPYDLMEQVDVLFLHFRSRAPILAASSIQNFLEECRKSRRPVFISEAVWNAKPAQRDLFFHTLFWSSLAMSSSAFLSPLERGSTFDFSGFDLQLAKAREEFMPLLDFTGPARPPSRAPVTVTPKDQYIFIDNLVGNDRLFWLFTREPGRSQAQLVLQTVEGIYELQWFDIETLAPLQRNRFNQGRKDLRIETPAFEQSIFGLLHLVKKGSSENKNGPPAPSSPDANGSLLGPRKTN